MKVPKLHSGFKVIIIAISTFLFWHFISAWPWFILLAIAMLAYRAFKNKQLQTLTPIYLLLASLVLSICFAEITLRAMGKNSSYKERSKNIVAQVLFTSYSSAFQYNNALLKYRPGQRNCGTSTTEFNYFKPANALGYVDGEWPVNKTSKPRYFFFGDSFTEGVGAPMDSSYVAILRKLTADTIQMYNAGIGGSDPCSEYMLLKKEIMPVYKPHRIYVAINQSDVFDVMLYGGLERFGDNGQVHLRQWPWWEGLYGQSYLIRLFIHQYRGLNWQFHTPQQAQAEQQLAITKMQACIDSFQSLTQQNGMECIFIFHPLRYEVTANTLTTAPLIAYASAKGYTTVNILDAFINKGVNTTNIHQYFWPIDGHNNSEGYRVIAEGLLETI